MEKCHLWMERCHPWMEKCHPWMSSMDGEMSSMDESVIRGCHPWMEKCHPWMEMPSVDVIHGWLFHPCMPSMDAIHGWRRRMTDMDVANIEVHSMVAPLTSGKTISYAPSMSVICRLHPWMSSIDDVQRWKSHPWMTPTDDTFIHGWHFSIHGWHPRMTLPSMDDFSPSMDDIHGWNFQLSGFWKKLLASCFK